MKTFAALLLLSVSVADAATIAVADNSTGGRIVLTSEPCDQSGPTLVAYTSTPGEQPSYGCWMFLRGAVYIGWKDIGEVLTYDPDAFRAPGPGDDV